MRDDFKNDEALAWGYAMIVLYFIVGAMLFLSWGVVINNVLTVSMNPMITAGDVSVQTVNTTTWDINALRYGVPLILLAGFIWVTNRAIFKRGGSS
jgi:hypothetical protein